MPDTPELTSGETSHVPPSAFEFDLGVAARLGARAEGAEIVTIDVPKDFAGLPRSVPALITRGDNPGVTAIDDVLDFYRLHPKRKKGTAETQTFESFCALVSRHATHDSAIFADCDWTRPSFTAVIDYHENTPSRVADWGQHRIRYAFPLSDEWKAWTEQNGKPMKQSDFAWFLEDRVAELASPTEHEKVTLEAQFATTIATPAQVVELSRGLAVHVDTRVKASTTLQTGEGQIAWEESHNGADGKPLKVPGLFMLSIAPFFMGEPIRIPVRLRYRAAGGALSWFYQIYRPDLAITEHVRHRLADAVQATNLPAYEGTPEMAA